jgi:hypothetical protein
LATLMFIAYGAALILHDVMNIPLPGSLKDAPYDPRVVFPIMLFGFLIGAVAVRDSRRAGRATIIERPERRAGDGDEPGRTWPVQSPLAGQPAE